MAIWGGSLIIWTRYVAASCFPAFRLTSSRLSMVLILLALFPESVYAS